MTEGVFYTVGGLDRAGVRHSDEAWVAERLGRRDTLVVPVWRNHSLITCEAAPEAALITGSAARKLIDIAGHVALLGLDGETAVAAIDLSDHEQGPGPGPGGAGPVHGTCGGPRPFWNAVRHPFSPTPGE